MGCGRQLGTHNYVTVAEIMAELGWSRPRVLQLVGRMPHISGGRGPSAKKYRWGRIIAAIDPDEREQPQRRRRGRGHIARDTSV